jgi:hypothetical protein
MVPERDLHTRYVGWSGTQQPGCRTQEPEEMSAGTHYAPAVNGGGDSIYLEVFDLREKLIARLAIFEGMRPGEIFALRWKLVRDEIIRVEQRVYERLLDSPKNGKTREGAMSDGTVALLKQWVELARNPSSEGFVFPSENLSTPLSADNVWRRNMKPRLEEIGMEWATFQFLRKTNASLSKKEDINPKVAADQRGHGNGSRPGGLYNIRYGAEKNSSEKARGRRASKTATKAVGVRQSSKWSKRSNEESASFRKSLKDGAGDGFEPATFSLGKWAMFCFQ